MGDAAAIPDHHRGRAPASPPPQGFGRRRPGRTAALKPGDWLEVFARIGAGVRRAVLPLAGTAEGRAPLAVGAGGDTTIELDRAAEAVVMAELASLVKRGERFSVLSEEAGSRSFGADYPRVLVDPVDGSLNAKQGVPLFGLMLAVVDGPSIADAYAGFVMNIVTGEEWAAIRNQGARHDRRPLTPLTRPDQRRIELLGLESTPHALKLASPLVERASKIRILGSMAISIALTATGGFDTLCAPMPVRVFDMAAGLLILKEAGGAATDVMGEPLDPLPCTLVSRSTLLCAPTPELHRAALHVLSSAR